MQTRGNYPYHWPLHSSFHSPRCIVFEQQEPWRPQKHTHVPLPCITFAPLTYYYSTKRYSYELNFCTTTVIVLRIDYCIADSLMFTAICPWINYYNCNGCNIVTTELKSCFRILEGFMNNYWKLRTFINGKRLYLISDCWSICKLFILLT